MDVALTTGLLAVASTDLFCIVIFLLGGNASNVESERGADRTYGKTGKSSGEAFLFWWRVPSIQQARGGFPMPEMLHPPTSWLTETARMTGRPTGTHLAGSARKRVPAGYQ